MEEIEQSYAERIGGSQFGKTNEVFKFEKIKRAKRKMRSLLPDTFLIDMGVGEPDLPADISIINVLKDEASKTANRFYADNGILEYRQAAAEYLDNIYGVTGLDPETEICHGIGSKSILAMLPFAFINPGDVTLVSVPGYPIMGSSTRYAGGQVYNMPLVKENGYLPDLKRIPEDICRRAKLMYINYPNNPTGAVANEEFFAEVIAFAKKHHIIVVNDLAYGAIVYGERKPLSFLSIPGAREVGVEVHSMSKAFCMTGWRLGFVAGNEKVVNAFATVKDNMDSGQFRAIQFAGIYALRHPELTALQVQRYETRMQALVNSLQKVGFDATMPAGTYYCYVKAPVSGKKINGSRVEFKDAEEVSTFLIEEAMISTVPWTDAGNYLRFSITYDTGHYFAREVMAELEARLRKLELQFE